MRTDAVGPKRPHLDRLRWGGSRSRCSAAVRGSEWRPSLRPLCRTGRIAGSKVAFQSNRDGGDIEIYTMNPDGSSQTRITTSAGRDANPDWSPDGVSSLSPEARSRETSG